MAGIGHAWHSVSKQNRGTVAQPIRNVPVDNPPVPCRMCGKEFVPVAHGRYVQRFCSQTCARRIDPVINAEELKKLDAEIRGLRRLLQEIVAVTLPLVGPGDRNAELRQIRLAALEFLARSS